MAIEQCGVRSLILSSFEKLFRTEMRMSQAVKNSCNRSASCDFAKLCSIIVRSPPDVLGVLIATAAEERIGQIFSTQSCVNGRSTPGLRS